MITVIKIIKGTKPKVLEENAAQWTAEYLSALKTGTLSAEVKYRYKHPEIKAALEAETHCKCAYCESKIKHVSYGDIEHILPKNRDARPDLYVEWTNLTLACEVCNRTNKSNYYYPEDPLLNPVEDDPNDYLISWGPFIYPALGKRKGEVTTNVLQLNRPDLYERRKERIERLLPLLDKWKSETNETYKRLLYDQICQEADASAEYSFTVKSYLNLVGFYNQS